eukprot:1091500-Prymnesium_polylepis.3
MAYSSTSASVALRPRARSTLRRSNAPLVAALPPSSPEGAPSPWRTRSETSLRSDVEVPVNFVESSGRGGITMSGCVARASAASPSETSSVSVLTTVAVR